MLKIIRKFFLGFCIGCFSYSIAQLHPEWSWSCGWIGACCYFWFFAFPKE